jgi:carboxymethylenebutenolidase
MIHPQPQGFLATPSNGKGLGVLVLHAWWGLNDTIKAFCTQLSEAGFVAFAPDLYHGKVANTIPEAEVLSQALDANHTQAKAEIEEATLFLNEQAEGGVAVIGFSLGAYYALHLSTTHPEHIHSVVVFYGTQGDFFSDFSTSKANYLGHFAEKDEYESQDNVDNLQARLKDAGRPVTFHIYPETGHWFFEPDRPQAYNQAAANLAWVRTLVFLKK